MPHFDLLQEMAALMSAWQVQALVLADTGGRAGQLGRRAVRVRGAGARVLGTQGFRWPWLLVEGFLLSQ